MPTNQIYSSDNKFDWQRSFVVLSTSLPSYSHDVLVFFGESKKTLGRLFSFFPVFFCFSDDYFDALRGGGVEEMVGKDI